MPAVSATRRFFKTYANEPAALTATLDILCVLPLLNPFSLEINIVLQSLLVLLAGALSWMMLIVHRGTFLALPRYLTTLLGLYIGWALLSLIFNHALINLFGSSFLRLGVLPLIACVGCGLFLRGVPTKRLLSWIYCSSVILAVISLASLRSFSSNGRFGGVFHQADILGVWMGCSLILGIGVWQLYPSRRRLIVVAQLLVLVTMLLSQTRAVILLVGLIGVIILLRSHLSMAWKVSAAAAMAVCLVFVVAVTGHLEPHILNRQDAAESVSYRADLQTYALRASVHHPFFGYGAGNVTKALSCPSLTSPSLQQTCQEGFYFNSSHNIYLDRVLAFGFVGGIAFLLIVLYALYAGLRTRGIDQYYAYAALIIALYYLTNVTNAPLELLLWVLLLRPFKVKSHEKI